MSQPIKLITNKEELIGTCYFEFVQGKYADSCWNDGSVFLDDEVFALIEPAFEKNIADFDRYTFTDVDKNQWEMIVNDLSEMKSKMLMAPSDLGRMDIIALIDSFSAWVQVNLVNHDCLSVLGL